MNDEEIVKSIFESNSEFSKHFILNVLNLKKGKFFYLGLREDSTGKDLESIISEIDGVFEQIDKYGFKNVVLSFKEVTFFADLGMATIKGYANWITDNGGKFIILEPKPEIEKFLKFVALDIVGTIYNSEQEFLDVMNK
ncbi:STAS domain-containing protein [Pontibacter lucknowensis]|uniref:Anti-anti-sigma regulatory factor (Antagonist of anti-sigma factor) n=1 Tax=Pontibacter lucknowensis TaxID=1077936 RepID=A0A1N7BGJ4_9BACT|nr:STAS domain-containing protein [Pontibacter lucknowensis]SIR50422.1 Anti-anti-sigma regulatory factor (antagonist of anti-sigma factor) [Pontibacter lucknowensis]